PHDRALDRWDRTGVLGRSGLRIREPAAMFALPWYVYLLQFVAGLFLANGVPHFVQGISGHSFQTPFASPPGVGESSPVVNVLWGFPNLARSCRARRRWRAFSKRPRR